MENNCPHCKSPKVKKNGHTHYDKQNHLCNDCGRQFVIGGQDWSISKETKRLIGRLLLERIPLAGVARVAEVSEVWLQGHIKEKYETLPDDLNVDIGPPETEGYLDGRFGEEIERLQKKKPNVRKNTQKWQTSRPGK